MPELIEVERYRQLAEHTVGRTVDGVEAEDAWYLKGGLTVETVTAAMVGQVVAASRRIGKLLLLDTVTGPSLGLRFGMTGRLVVDGIAGVDDLEYASRRIEPKWDRFSLRFGGGGSMRMQDPRRLGGVLLEPVEERLGVEASAVTLGQLRKATAGSRGPLKARLMDQSRIAGIGNLLVDEILWRGRLDPRRPAGSLSDAELRRLHRHLRATVLELTTRGGSHTGDLQAERRTGGCCPRDGAPLERAVVGGRTTYWCPRHQG